MYVWLCAVWENRSTTLCGTLVLWWMTNYRVNFFEQLLFFHLSGANAKDGENDRWCGKEKERTGAWTNTYHDSPGQLHNQHWPNGKVFLMTKFSSKQALNQDSKSLHPKCSIGSAQMNNLYT